MEEVERTDIDFDIVFNKEGAGIIVYDVVMIKESVIPCFIDEDKADFLKSIEDG